MMMMMIRRRRGRFLPSFLPGIDRERLYEKEYEKGGEGLFFFPSVRFPSLPPPSVPLFQPWERGSKAGGWVPILFIEGPSSLFPCCFSPSPPCLDPMRCGGGEGISNFLD